MTENTYKNELENLLSDLGINLEKKPKIYRNKGNSLITLPSDYCIVDIETTGLDPSFDEILEISATKYRNNILVGKFSSLVKPPNKLCEYGDNFETIVEEYYVPDYIENLTGISNSMIEEAPDLAAILPQFIDFIGDDILIGHNVTFDINFLYDAILELFDKQLKNDYVCTVRLSRLLFPNEKHHRLKDMLKLYNIDFDKMHRSYIDCELTAKLYSNLKSTVVSQYGTIENFNQLHKRINKPLNIKSFKPESTDIDTSTPFYNKTFAFTGKLEMFVRKDAMQLVVNLGGSVVNSVTKKTNYLVLGNNDYCKLIKDGKSSKQKKAEELILKGQDLQIITENVFYDMLDSINS